MALWGAMQDPMHPKAAEAAVGRPRAAPRRRLDVWALLARCGCHQLTSCCPSVLPTLSSCLPTGRDSTLQLVRSAGGSRPVRPRWQRTHANPSTGPSAATSSTDEEMWRLHQELLQQVGGLSDQQLRLQWPNALIAASWHNPPGCWNDGHGKALTVGVR